MLGQLEAAQARQVQIQQADVEIPCADLAQCRQRMARMHHFMAARTQQPAHHISHGCIILDQQHAQWRHVGRILAVHFALGLCIGIDHQRQRQGHAKTRAAAALALHLDTPLHRLRQFAADRQAQAAAAVLRRGAGAIGLLEAAEQALLLFLADARPGVAHFEMQRAQLAVAARMQGDGSAAGELDRVGEQVEQDLPYPHRIAGRLQARRQLVVEGEAQALLRCQRSHQRGQVLQQAAQRERLGLQLQPSGFDPCQVQCIVDQVKQVFAGVPDRLRVAALLRVQRRGQQQFAHAEHTGHRRADFVAEIGQEAGLGRRGLFGQFLFMQCQLIGMAPLQATAIQPGKPTGQQKRDRGQHQQPGQAAPPRWLYTEFQALHPRPDMVGRARLYLQAVAARRQAREQALTSRPHFHPIGVVAGQAVAVAVGGRIGE